MGSIGQQTTTAFRSQRTLHGSNAAWTQNMMRTSVIIVGRVIEPQHVMVLPLLFQANRFGLSKG
jgi:hypothetical protein